MAKVKIKRVKRDKYTSSAKKKLLVGLGVGSSLLGGGIAQASGSASQPKPIVSTRDNSDEGKTSKVKQTLQNIFGVKEAKASGWDEGWDVNFSVPGGATSGFNSGSGGGAGDGSGIFYDSRNPYDRDISQAATKSYGDQASQETQDAIAKDQWAQQQEGILIDNYISQQEQTNGLTITDNGDGTYHVSGGTAGVNKNVSKSELVGLAGQWASSGNTNDPLASLPVTGSGNSMMNFVSPTAPADNSGSGTISQGSSAPVVNTQPSSQGPSTGYVSQPPVITEPPPVVSPAVPDVANMADPTQSFQKGSNVTLPGPGAAPVSFTDTGTPLYQAANGQTVDSSGNVYGYGSGQTGSTNTSSYGNSNSNPVVVNTNTYQNSNYAPVQNNPVPSQQSTLPTTIQNNGNISPALAAYYASLGINVVDSQSNQNTTPQQSVTQQVSEIPAGQDSVTVGDVTYTRDTGVPNFGTPPVIAPQPVDVTQVAALPVQNAVVTPAGYSIDQDTYVRVMQDPILANTFGYTQTDMDRAGYIIEPNLTVTAKADPVPVAEPVAVYKGFMNEQNQLVDFAAAPSSAASKPVAVVSVQGSDYFIGQDGGLHSTENASSGMAWDENTGSWVDASFIETNPADAASYFDTENYNAGNPAAPLTQQELEQQYQGEATGYVQSGAGYTDTEGYVAGSGNTVLSGQDLQQQYQGEGSPYAESASTSSSVSKPNTQAASGADVNKIVQDAQDQLKGIDGTTPSSTTLNMSIDLPNGTKAYTQDGTYYTDEKGNNYRYMEDGQGGGQLLWRNEQGGYSWLWDSPAWDPSLGKPNMADPSSDSTVKKISDTVGDVKGKATETLDKGIGKVKGWFSKKDPSKADNLNLDGSKLKSLGKLGIALGADALGGPVAGGIVYKVMQDPAKWDQVIDWASRPGDGMVTFTDPDSGQKVTLSKSDVRTALGIMQTYGILDSSGQVVEGTGMGSGETSSEGHSLPGGTTETSSQGSGEALVISSTPIAASAANSAPASSVTPDEYHVEQVGEGPEQIYAFVDKEGNRVTDPNVIAQISAAQWNRDYLENMADPNLKNILSDDQAHPNFNPENPSDTLQFFATLNGVSSLAASLKDQSDMGANTASALGGVTLPYPVLEEWANSVNSDGISENGQAFFNFMTQPIPVLDSNGNPTGKFEQLANVTYDKDHNPEVTLNTNLLHPPKSEEDTTGMGSINIVIPSADTTVHEGQHGTDFANLSTAQANYEKMDPNVQALMAAHLYTQGYDPTGQTAAIEANAYTSQPTMLPLLSAAQNASPEELAGIIQNYTGVETTVSKNDSGDITFFLNPKNGNPGEVITVPQNGGAVTVAYQNQPTEGETAHENDSGS